MRAGKPWHKNYFKCAKCRKSLESTTLRKKGKSIVKVATHRTLGLKPLATAKELTLVHAQ